MTKRNKFYQIGFFALAFAFIALCAYMGITAVQKSMRLNVGFSAVPSIKVLIQIEDPQADDGYRTIFRNDTNTQIGAGLEIHGNTLQFTNTFADSEPNIGASFVLKFTNLMTNTGLKASVIGNSATANPTYVTMKESGSEQDTATMTVSGSSDLATLQLMFSEYNEYAVAVSPSSGNFTYTANPVAISGENYTANIKAKTGYNLSITVTRDDGTTTTLTEGQEDDYVWDSSTGALTIYARAVTGDITINCLNDNAISYTISYILDGGSLASGETNPTAYTVESQITLNNPTKTGYNFAGWTGTGLNGATQSVTISQMTGDRSYTATWTIIEYTISYTLNGGTNPASNPTKYTVESANITLQAPTRGGYSFTGWTGSNGSTAQTSVTIAKGSTGNKSYTANWSANSYTVTLNNQTATTAGTTSVSATYGSAMPSITKPTKTGYTFGGYYTSTNGDGTQYYTSAGASAKNYDKASTLTLYAKWTAITYTVVYNANGGSGTMSNSTLTYDKAQNLTANAFSRSYCTFKNWNTAADGSGTTYNNSQSVTNLSSTQGATITLYAQWNLSTATYTKNGLTFNAYSSPTIYQTGTSGAYYVYYTTAGTYSSNSVEWIVLGGSTATTYSGGTDSTSETLFLSSTYGTSWYATSSGFYIGGTQAKTLLLLSRYVLGDAYFYYNGGGGGASRYSKGENYSDDLKYKMDQMYNTSNTLGLGTTVKNKILATTVAKTTYYNYNNATPQTESNLSLRFFPLGGDSSYGSQPVDSFNISKYFTSSNARKAYSITSKTSAAYWLRSGSYNVNRPWALYIGSSGSVSIRHTYDSAGVRPCFVFNLA